MSVTDARALHESNWTGTDESQRPLAKAEMRRVMAGLCLAMLLSALDQTIVVTALPTIGLELGDFVASPGSSRPISSPRRS